MIKPALRIRTVFGVTTLATVLLLTFLLIMAWRIQQTQAAIVAAYQARIELYRLAAEMQQSSNDLTRMARLYVTTGEPRFRQYYRDILDIRNGKLPRPPEYSAAYWELMIGNAIKAPAGGEKQALLARLDELEVTPVERELFLSSLRESDAILVIEAEAFATVGASRPGPDDILSGVESSDRQSARRLLNDSHYLEAKARVMAPLEQFRLSVWQRTTQKVQALNRQQAAQANMTFVMLGLTLLFVLVNFAYVSRSIVRPIRALHQHAKAITANNYAARNDVRTGNELQALGEALNTSATAVESDLKQRMQATEELKRSETRFRTLVTTTSQIVWWTSADGTVKSDMPSWRAYTGQSLDEIQGNGWSCALHPDDVERVLEVWNKAVETRSFYEVEYRIRRHDGIYRLFLVRGTPLLDVDGNIIEWIGACNDITDRRSSEQELAHSHQFLQSTLDALSAHIAILDQEGTIIGVNEAWKNFSIGNSSSITRADLGTNYLQVCDLARGEDAAEAAATAQGIRDVIAGRRDLFTLEYACHSPQLQRWFEVRVTRFAEAGSTPVVVAHQNVTERKLAEIRMQKFNEELEARVQSRTAELESAIKDLEGFSYSVSHDLRAPLRAIESFSGILMEEYTEVLDAEGKRLFKVVRDNTARMSRLIDDMLEFSRAGRRELQFSGVDLAAMAREVFAELHNSAEGRRVEFDVQGDLPVSSCDRAAIRQVLVNLLSNALKFTQLREVSQIRVGGMTTGLENVYSISDNGAGFDMKYVHKLFGVFQRLHGPSEFEGTGIGLAIVRRIIEKHGGKVWAESELGKGATFHFSLPQSGYPQITKEAP